MRAITDATGAKVESAIYRPFGEQSEWLLPGNASPETKGWIGERYDADAGLQYLNARYYDPALGLFLQPDWFEVTKPGVGTNRFSYSFNDPVNKFDPGGNYFDEELFKRLEAGLVVTVETTTWAVSRTLGLAAALVLDTSKVGVNDTAPNRPDVGKILTREMVERGWYVDGKSQLVAPDGEIIVDKDGRWHAPEVYSSQKEFDKARYDGKSQRERDAFSTKELGKIAEFRGWEYDKGLSKRTKKEVYKTEFGYAVVDNSHGQYEYHDKKGKHLGQYNIEGNMTKKPNRRYDIEVE